MLTDEVFLQAIRADPQDDAPCLIYADWLEERGDPRAALYRCLRWTNALGMKFVLVPRGSFFMGDRGEQRPVEIPHEFYIGAHPVTQRQWEMVMGNNPSCFSHSGDGASVVSKIATADLWQFPVEQVSWDDVQQFLTHLNERERYSGFVYGLPAEAEWEYACRGAATSEEECAFDFYFTQPTNDLSFEQANFNGRHPAGSGSMGKYLDCPTNVGSYESNRLGLYDMHGNVFEWCQDLFRSDGTARVIRGGCWRTIGSFCRASIRSCLPPGRRSDGVGFRLAAIPSGK